MRVVCHVAAELPLMVFALIEMARGWRPLYDNAGLALRSYQVFSSRSPLVGHQMADTVDHHVVFAPGPLQNWLLAVPVRLDPAQGALWGAVLCAVIAVAVSIEAMWAAGGWKAASAASASILVLFIVRTDVALMVLWDVWFAVVFLVAAVCAGLATATGQLRWWPVTVVAASVAAQCQAVFALPVIAVCLVAPVVGIAVGGGRGHRMGRAWLAVGLGVGAWSGRLRSSSRPPRSRATSLCCSGALASQEAPSGCPGRWGHWVVLSAQCRPGSTHPHRAVVSIWWWRWRTSLPGRSGGVRRCWRCC